MAESPSDPLVGVQAKLDRADHHMKSLNTEFQRFLSEDDPYGVLIEEYPKSRSYIARMEVFEDPPPVLSVIVGDVAHNLRSALDHLISRLVEASGNKAGWPNAFPIFLDEREFVTKVEFPRDGCGKKIRGQLEGISRLSDAWALVQRAQPYQRGDQAFDHPLRWLNWLSNRDKHSLVHASFVRPQVRHLWDIFHWSPEAKLVEKRVLIEPWEALEDKTKLALLRFDAAGPDPGVSVDGPLPMRIAFGKEPAEADSTAPALEDLRDYAAEIVRCAEPLLATRPGAYTAMGHT